MQCEGTRGWYLHQAAKLSGHEAAIEQAVCQKFSGISKDTWLFEHLTSILYNFAMDGSEAAKNALYDKYDSMLNELSRKRKFQQICDRRDMFDWLCIWLTSLSGFGAFKMIVDDISESLLTKNADFFFSDWFYSNSEHKFGEKRIEQYLQKQSDKSPYIRAYYKKAKEMSNRSQKERPIPTLDEVLASAKGGFRSVSARMLVMRFAKNATPEDLEKLAQAAMNEPNAEAQVQLLWAFRHDNIIYAFPEEFLLRLSQSSDEQLRSLAYEIIGKTPSPKTREFARSVIQSGADIENGISLLAKNLLPKDEILLYDAVKSIHPNSDRRDWHGAYMDAEKGIKSMRGKPKTNILEYLYRNTLCSWCREFIVRTMHKKGVLSDEILSECLLDSNSEVQSFAKRISQYRNRPKGNV